MSKRTAEQLSIPPAKRTPTTSQLKSRITALETKKSYMEFALDAIDARAARLETKYGALFHFTENDVTTEQEKELEEKYPEEYSDLTSDDTTVNFWQDGFVRAALKTTRLFHGLATFDAVEHPTQDNKPLQQRVEELERETTVMKTALKAVEATSKEFEHKYCDLVHMARGSDERFRKEMEKKFPAEYKRLTDDDEYESNDQHGYNSGALATGRLFRGLCQFKPHLFRANSWELGSQEELDEERAMTGIMVLQRQYDFHIENWPELSS